MDVQERTKGLFDLSLVSDESEQNTSSAAGAARLKARIEEYWIARGYVPPQITPVNMGFSHHTRCARVELRSDMINGMPRRRVAIVSEAA